MHFTALLNINLNIFARLGHFYHRDDFMKRGQKPITYSKLFSIVQTAQV
jgi:hypothetical protein